MESDKKKGAEKTCTTDIKAQQKGLLEDDEKSNVHGGGKNVRPRHKALELPNHTPDHHRQQPTPGSGQGL